MQRRVEIITRHINNSVNQAYLDGYLSPTLYFVDGKVLEPTAFGQSFEGKWGPLEGSKVIANVNGFGDNGFHLPFKTGEENNYQVGPITAVDEGGSYHLPYARRITNSVTGGEAALQRNTTAFNVQQATLSCWVKQLSTNNGTNIEKRCYLYAEALDNNNRTEFVVDSNGKLMLVQRSTNVVWHGSIVNPDEWTHVVYKIVGTKCTPYINGISLGEQNAADALGDLGKGHKGRIGFTSANVYNNFELTQLIFISDKAYEPETFGYKSASGEWVSKSIVQISNNIGNNYGQNGFYLDFDPTTGGGYLADKSGNGNDFTESTGRNTIEVTAPNTPGSDNITSLGLDDVSAVSIGDYITEVGNGNDGKGTVAFIDDTLKRVYLDANEPNWDVGSNIKNDTIISIGTDASGQGNHFYDENFETNDSVLDTPMKNYAVLETGSNGNLVATAAGTNLTYTGEAGTDYYYEADGVGATHTGGSAFSSTDGVAYNFGQQPFVQTPTVEGRLYQEWSQWARTPLGFALDRIAKLESFIQNIVSRLTTLEGN